MAKRIGQLAVTVAPEHICDRHFYFGASLYGAIKGCVHAVQVNVQSHADAAGGLGRERAILRELIAQHDDGIANAQFSMHDLAVRALHDALLYGSESLLVELDGASSIADGQKRSDGVITLRNSSNGH